MKHPSRSALVCAAAAAAMVSPSAFGADATVFSDNFSSSTLNSATPAAPTATSADYSVLSSKSALGSSIGSGHLHLAIGTTSSGLAEVQSRFATTPISLMSAGQYIQMQLTFTATGLNLLGNNNLNFGLYNTGGVNPVSGGAMANALLGTANTTYTTGNAQNWLGFVGRLGTGLSGNSELFNRSAQTGVNNQNQDVVFHDGVTGGFDAPNATFMASGSGGTVLTDGNQYTFTLRLTRNGDGFIDMLQNIYAGGDTSGANLFTQSGTTDGTSTVTTEFDGLAFGYRAGGGGAPIDMDVNALLITTNVPEPSTFALVGLGALGLLLRRKA